MEVVQRYNCCGIRRCLHKEKVVCQEVRLWDAFCMGCIWKAMSKGCSSNNGRVTSRVEGGRLPGFAAGFWVERDFPKQVQFQENLSVNQFSVWTMSGTPYPKIVHQLQLGLWFTLRLRRGNGWRCCYLGVKVESVKRKQGNKIIFIWAIPEAHCP